MFYKEKLILYFQQYIISILKSQIFKQKNIFLSFKYFNSFYLVSNLFFLSYPGFPSFLFLIDIQLFFFISLHFDHSCIPKIFLLLFFPNSQYLLHVDSFIMSFHNHLLFEYSNFLHFQFSFYFSLLKNGIQTSMSVLSIFLYNFFMINCFPYSH